MVYTWSKHLSSIFCLYKVCLLSHNLCLTCMWATWKLSVHGFAYSYPVLLVQGVPQVSSGSEMTKALGWLKQLWWWLLILRLGPRIITATAQCSVQLGKWEMSLSGCALLLLSWTTCWMIRNESVSCTEWVPLVGPFVICCRVMEAWGGRGRTLRVQKNPATPTRRLLKVPQRAS